MRTQAFQSQFVRVRVGGGTASTPHVQKEPAFPHGRLSRKYTFFSVGVNCAAARPLVGPINICDWTWSGPSQGFGNGSNFLCSTDRAMTQFPFRQQPQSGSRLQGTSSRARHTDDKDGKDGYHFGTTPAPCSDDTYTASPSAAGRLLSISHETLLPSEPFRHALIF
jgi:hypothetical protein